MLSIYIGTHVALFIYKGIYILGFKLSWEFASISFETRIVWARHAEERFQVQRFRHSGEGRSPELFKNPVIPAFAGMT
jgi:hypothetical protein